MYIRLLVRYYIVFSYVYYQIICNIISFLPNLQQPSKLICLGIFTRWSIASITMIHPIKCIVPKHVINDRLVRQIYMYKYYCTLIYADKHEYLKAYMIPIHS
jgi:hypothetical protein